MAENAATQNRKILERQNVKASIGQTLEVFSAKTQIKGQDGGVVTALLIKGLKESKFDATIVVKRTQGYNAEVIGTDKAEEILAAKGTKYLRVNVLPKLRKLAEQGKRKIAVTCTPCQARTVRKMEPTLKQQFPGLEITVIGLFCFEAFNAVKLKEEANRVLKLDLDKAEQTQIRKGKFNVNVDGQAFSCKIRELSQAVEKGCCLCGDFTAECADVSVGSVGSEAGFSSVIVRSVKGKELCKGLEAVKADVDMNEIVKLSSFKAERAQKSSFNLKS
jgi:coenzyme F420 hydrogenase subunit beta